MILGGQCVQEAAYLAKKWTLQNKTEEERTVYFERPYGNQKWCGQNHWDVDSPYSYCSGGTPYETLDTSDLILVVGTHPRHEAALLNARILKAIRQNPTCKVLWMGSPRKTNYPVEFGGFTPEHLFALGEGRHPWCTEIKRAKHPVVLVGANLLERTDGMFFGQVFKQLQKRAPIFYIHATPNRVGLMDAGVKSTYSQPESATLFWFWEAAMDKRIWVLPENPSKTGTTVDDVVFTPYGGAEHDTRHQGLYMAACHWFEKMGTWRNMEGRAQTLKPSIKPYQDSKNEIQWLGTWLKSRGEYWVKTMKDYFVEYAEQNPKTSINVGWLKDISLSSTAYEKGLHSQEPMRSCVNHFHQTDTLTAQSKILQNCSSVFDASDDKATDGRSFVEQ